MYAADLNISGASEDYKVNYPHWANPQTPTHPPTKQH